MSELAPFRQGRVAVGSTSLAYLEWGPQDATDIVLCAHGLTRSGRDFDFLARALLPQRRVIAFDFPGRGGSDWLPDAALYNYGTYADHALALMDALGLECVDWIGTSMGGILGMMMAARAPQRLRRLVLNDVGALVTRQSLERIMLFPTLARSYADRAEADDFYRTVFGSWGPLSEPALAHLTEHSLRRLPDGRLAANFDPAIRTALAASPPADIDLWPLWAAVTQPVLLLRGADSDLLLRCTALGMVARGNVAFLEIPGAGHAPALMSEDQIRPIIDWLEATQDSCSS